MEQHLSSLLDHLEKMSNGLQLSSVAVGYHFDTAVVRRALFILWHWRKPSALGRIQAMFTRFETVIDSAYLDRVRQYLEIVADTAHGASTTLERTLFGIDVNLNLQRSQLWRLANALAYGSPAMQ